MAKSPARQKRGKKSSLMTFLFLILPAALVVLPTTVLFGVGLVPTLVALVTDRDPDKTAAITVGGLNFCGCMPYAIDLWKTGHSVAGVMSKLADPLTWLVIYGAAGAGWLLYFTIPPLVATTEIGRAEKRIEMLKKKRITLIQEWGPDVSGDPADEPAQDSPQSAR
jgi:hypothetical protein